MDVRQHLVEEWKAKLAANGQAPAESGERFGWVRQIYVRIYRFLVSCYGEGDWRGASDASSASAESSSATSHMPFVDYRSTTAGLAPKSPERIRAALDSIHSSNPGIATAGMMSGVDDDTWVVVAASRKPPYASAVYRRLVACGIKAHLQDRTTDMAVIVRHEDFQKALAVVKKVGRAKRNRFGMRRTSDHNFGTAEQIRISTRATVDPIVTVGVFLFISSLLTFLAFILLSDAMQRSTRLVICALWIAGLAAGWLYTRGCRTV